MQGVWFAIAVLVMLPVGCRTPTDFLSSSGTELIPCPARLNGATRQPVTEPSADCRPVRALPQAGTTSQDELATCPAAKSSAGEEPRESQQDNTREVTVQLAAAVLPAETEDTQRNPVEPRFVSLSLEDAIATALEFNPDLVTMRAGEPVAHAAYHVAKTYPFNPQFQTQILPYTRDRNGNEASVDQQYAIVQTFELAHQKRFRTAAAAAGWQQTSNSIRAEELASIAQTTRSFFGAIYQRALRDQARSLATLNDNLIGVLQRRFEAGQANAADVTLVRLETQSLRRQAELAEANYQTALLNLMSYLNLDSTVPLELCGELPDEQWRPLESVLAGSEVESPDADDPEAVAEIDDAALQQLVASRPDVQAAWSAVEAARADLGLAEAARTPDLQIGPTYARDDAATEFWGLQAQIDIPAVNTGKPLVRQRVVELRRQEIAATQLETKAMAEARAAVQRYERARRLVAGARADFERPPADVLQPVENQFKAGQIGLLQVFAARTSLAQSHRSYLDLLNELAQAAADVTQATGIGPQELMTGGRSVSAGDSEAAAPPEETPLP